ncbi:MAG: hypothetical protein JST28_09175 [Acidobacteria bacterium]|nr:hypothetical protein [Acidobacteriota bacterium]
MKLLKSAGLFVVACVLAGCPNWERSAFQTLGTAQQTINDAHQAYEASAIAPCPANFDPQHPCLPHTQAVHDVIARAQAADKTAVDAMVAYENAKTKSAGQPALNQAQADVETALSVLPAILGDVKALYGGK